MTILNFCLGNYIADEFIAEILILLTLTLLKLLLLLYLCCVRDLLIYTIFVNILCVSQEWLSLVKFNQQIYDFYKGVIFGKQRHCAPQ